MSAPWSQSSRRPRKGCCPQSPRGLAVRSEAAVHAGGSPGSTLPCSCRPFPADVMGESTTPLGSEFSARLGVQRQKAHLSTLAEPTTPVLGEVETINSQVTQQTRPTPKSTLPRRLRGVLTPLPGRLAPRGGLNTHPPARVRSATQRAVGESRSQGHTCSGQNQTGLKERRAVQRPHDSDRRALELPPGERPVLPAGF